MGWGGRGVWVWLKEETRAREGAPRMSGEKKIFPWLELFALGDVSIARKTPSTSSTLASVPSGGLLSFWIKGRELFPGLVVYK